MRQNWQSYSGSLFLAGLGAILMVQAKIGTMAIPLFWGAGFVAAGAILALRTFNMNHQSDKR